MKSGEIQRQKEVIKQSIEYRNEWEKVVESHDYQYLYETWHI